MGEKRPVTAEQFRGGLLGLAVLMGMAVFVVGGTMGLALVVLDLIVAVVLVRARARTVRETR